MKRIGQGRTAEVFEWDETKIVKLFYKGKGAWDAEKEWANLRLVNELEVPSPKVFETVTIDGRFGIIEEKLIGKNGLEVLPSLINPRTAEAAPAFCDLRSFTEQMCDLQKILNQKQHTAAADYKDCLMGSLWSVTDGAEKARICAKIDALPSGNNLCHGDFHPGNIFVKTDGAPVIIDFVNLCRAPALFDIARTYFLLTRGELPSELSEKDAERFAAFRTDLALLYLETMQTPLDALSPFIDVIAEVRKYEFN